MNIARSSPDQSCDVLIAGGGMVGASLAAALASLPLRVRLVEAVPPGSSGQPSFDGRTTALSRSSREILGALGLWPDLGEHAAPIRRIHVSERGSFGSTVLDADEQQVEALGYVLENAVLGRVLWDELGRHDNLAIHAPAVASGAVTGPDTVLATVEQGGIRQQIATRLLVVADGSQSRLRAAIGLGVTRKPYGQTAIVGNVGVQGGGPVATAFERFTPEGPAALLPAGPDRYVFVLTRRESAAAAVLAMPDADFLALLQSELGFRAGRLNRLGRRSAYPLELVCAEHVTAPRVAIVGNAAHGLHPVAGQGYNLGLRDVAALAEVIADAVALLPAADPGDAGLLARYAAWRRPDQRKVVAFTDGLIGLFGRPGMGGLRGAGLQLFDAVPGARSLLARETMGLGGRRTRLARGMPL